MSKGRGLLPKRCGLGPGFRDPGQGVLGNAGGLRHCVCAPRWSRQWLWGFRWEKRGTARRIPGSELPTVEQEEVKQRDCGEKERDPSSVLEGRV